MDPDFLASLTWRDALLGLVAVLAIYVLVVFWRMRRLQATAASVVPAAQAGAALAAYGAVAAVDDAGDGGKRGAAKAGWAAENAAAAAVSATADQPASTAPAPPAFAWNEPPPQQLADQRDVEAHERELAHLRALSAALSERVATLDTSLKSLRSEVRGELAALREELRREVDEVNTAQHVSPLYGEAMQMALQGADASAISERCGIARAEAELVVALTRKGNDESVH
ncbi:DUF2802 domain-containing protein [Rhodocyclus tenuis]|uniref:DUF2802 domain-containing protein n=1 Tax=Rhodocyclus tenuis TaxID=1066 RepID=UPI0019078C20|nr:DUF2802 domain-containing protein [Rhodocyclus tenuis]MBK1680569.1 hypothetical protein [Rhodocyclus tenuis]